MPHRCLAILFVLCAALLGGCQQRQDSLLEYAFQKQGATEQQKADDEQVVLHTSGVSRVLIVYDKGRIEVALYLSADNKIPGLEKALELGYQQLGNQPPHN